MLTKDELAAIKEGFANGKLHTAGTGAVELEIGFEAIVNWQLAELVRAVVKTVEHAVAFKWLQDIVFNSKKLFFATAKEAYVHVMAVLNTLIAVAK